MSDAVRSGSNFCIGKSASSKVLQKVGNAIYCVNLYSVDNAIKLKVGNAIHCVNLYSVDNAIKLKVGNGG